MDEPVIPGTRGYTGNDPLPSQQAEARSSIKVTTNAKGEVQTEVKLYSGDVDNIDALRAKTVETFNALRAELAATAVLA